MGGAYSKCRCIFNRASLHYSQEATTTRAAKMAKIFAIEIIALSLSVILFFAILLKDLHAVEENNFVSSKFAENYELRHVELSDVNLLSTQKTRSKLKCATLCDLEEKCKMFRFEAPSRSCYMYREVTTGGCFGFTSRNVSSYYTHLGMF